MGRTKLEHPKNRFVNIRVDEETWQLMDIIAKDCGTTKSRILLNGFQEILMRFRDDEMEIFLNKLDAKMGKQTA